MGESVFEVVKQSVTAREAAELYGIAVGRGGMACCPFHDDRHPSMKVDTRFHCFGCGADGDVIDFTARFYDLSPKEAAEKLAQDFGLSYDSKAPPRRSYVRAVVPASWTVAGPAPRFQASGCVSRWSVSPPNPCI